MCPRLNPVSLRWNFPLWVVAALLCAPAWAAPPQQDSAQAKQSTGQAASDANASSPILKGKKLVLKDGTYQMVREYQRNGDRVRYFSTERGTWEEIPAAMVDWDATKKAEKLEDEINNALVKQVHIQEAAANAQTPIDVDASLMVAPGAFLPQGEGMFAVEGKKVLPLEQVGSQVKTDKATVLKQVLTPIPVIPSKHNVEIPGPKATIRLTSDHPEFFLRQPPPDPDRVSSIERSSRVGDTGPEVVLVRAKVKGNKRLLESIRSYFGQQISQERDEISVQRWDVAPDVYRFTLSQSLAPGEYAFAELLPDGMNLFVWDFAVDTAPAAKAQAQ
jgi:hypothetical protein